MTDQENKESHWRSSSSNDNGQSRGKNWRYGNRNNRDRYYKQERQGYYDNKFGKRTFNRNWSKNQNTGKKAKLQVGSRLKEPEVGITEFIGDHVGICGIVKERYSDFHVNEIDVNGEVAKLTNQEMPAEPEETEDIEDLKKLVPESIWNSLQVLQNIDASTTMVEIDVTDMDKTERRSIHNVAKKLTNVTSQTVDRDGKKIMMIIPNNRKNMNVTREFQRDTRINWEARGGNYCHFILHKVNMDTMDALNQLAMNLRIKPNNFAYSGTKDRRAWTTQWVSIRKTEPQQILRAGRTIRGVYVGNFKFAKDPLKLGMLNGNRFRIALRNITASDEEIECAMTSLRDNGFINYYGLQRFGTIPAIPTYEIGKKLLQAKWNEAVELILKPREGEQDTALSEARAIYAETKDAYAAHQKIMRLDKIEAALLKGLYLHKNAHAALDCIPRNARLMYIHSYQSYVWNHMVSRRIKEYGSKPIVGDLVYKNPDTKEETETEIEDTVESQKEICQTETETANNTQEETMNNAAKENSKLKLETDEKLEIPNTEEQQIQQSTALSCGESQSNQDDKEKANLDDSKDESMTDNIDEVMVATECNLKIEENVEQEKSNDEKEEQESSDLPPVKILTEKDLPNYTLADVLMPQPGWKVVYPPYAKPWFDEFLAKDDLTTDLRHKNKKYSLGGGYRKILQVPSDMSWKIMHYNEKYSDFIISDIEEMRKMPPPVDKPDGQKKALIVEMSLQASGYATMALREITKSDTSPQVQAAQTAAHAEEDAAESSAAIDQNGKQKTDKENNINEEMNKEKLEDDRSSQSTMEVDQEMIDKEDLSKENNTQKEDKNSDESGYVKSDETGDNSAST